MHRLSSRNTGMSLIELLVSITIGAILMLGLVSTFTNSSDSQRELKKSSELIENGRYAIDLISQDLRLTGFFGHFYHPPAPASFPDPCETSSTTNMEAAIGMPIQFYSGGNLNATLGYPNISATSCDDKGLLVNDNLMPGSDILAIRRLDTEVFSGTPVDGEIYMQANRDSVKIEVGNDAAGDVDGTDDGSKTADNQVQTMRKYPSAYDPSLSSWAATDIKQHWADTRKFHVHVYFVAPCSRGSGANGVCVKGTDYTDDDSIPRLPTLKRLELTTDGTSTDMQIVPLVEGIEVLKFHFGLDHVPTPPSEVTGESGDGVPDRYTTALLSVNDYLEITAIRVFALARTIKPTTGHVDSKLYTLGGFPYGAPPLPPLFNYGPTYDTYKRHLFSAVVMPMNLAGRREIPE